MARKKFKARDITNADSEENWQEYLPQVSVKTFNIKNKFKFNDVHQTLYNLCTDERTKMILVDGPAGTAKTYISVMAGLTMLKEKQTQQIIYIRSIVESAHKSIGALPGEIDDKFKPWSLPLIEKMNECVHPAITDKLMDEGQVKSLPVNFVRGLTFHDSFVIVDEAQNLTKDELVTILTRFGMRSKYVVIGDGMQKDIGKSSGFSVVFNSFNDEESANHGIHAMKFGENEIVRSPILKFIVRKLS